VAQKTSRKRRRRPRPSGGSAEPAGSALQRGYARGRAKDEAARAALKPLRPGERPTAVTVGAAAAGLLALANLLALVAGWDAGPGSGDRDGQAVAGTLLVTGVLCVVAYGMWKGRYWAVLGMQTLLALTMVVCALALLTAINLWALLLVLILLLGSGTLFWFLVKAMARIQMPERPSGR
jgi:cation transport ATPase